MTKFKMIFTVVICCALLGLFGCSKSIIKSVSETSSTTVPQSLSVTSGASSSRQISSSALQSSSKSQATSSSQALSKIQVSSTVQKPANADHIICIDPGHQKKVDLSMEPIAPGATITKYKNPGGTTGVATKLPEYALNMIVGQKLGAKA